MILYNARTVACCEIHKDFSTVFKCPKVKCIGWTNLKSQVDHGNSYPVQLLLRKYDVDNWGYCVNIAEIVEFKYIGELSLHRELPINSRPILWSTVHSIVTEILKYTPQKQKVHTHMKCYNFTSRHCMVTWLLTQTFGEFFHLHIDTSFFLHKPQIVFFGTNLWKMVQFKKLQIKKFMPGESQLL